MPKSKKAPETGLFPSYRPKTHRRPAQRRTSQNGEPLNEVRVRCIKNGQVRGFIDDGGKQVEGVGFIPGGYRQQLMRNLQKRDTDGHPVFFVDSQDEVVNLRGTYGMMSTPVASPQILDAMDAYLERAIEEKERNERSLKKGLINQKAALDKAIASTGSESKSISDAIAEAKAEGKA